MTNPLPEKTVELVLTCGSWQEAQRIVDHLLKERLVACAEFIPVKSKFSWHQAFEEADEVKLIMLSLDKFFEKVEAEIKQLHSYETFVLKALPVTHLSTDAWAWVQEVCKERQLLQ